MGLRPEDIKDKNFKTNFRGYNIDQVNDFMDRILKDYSRLIKNYKHVAKYASSAHHQLTYYKKREKAVSQSIIVAKTAGDKVIANAHKEGKIIKNNARKEALNLTKHTQQKLEQRNKHENERFNMIIAKANGLCNSTQSFRRHIHNLLKGQLDFTDDYRWNQFFKQESKVTNYKVANISQRYANNSDKQQFPSRMDHKAIIFYPNGHIREFN